MMGVYRGIIGIGGYDGPSETRSVLSSEGAIVLVVLKNADRIYAVVVEPLHPVVRADRVALRPLGCRSTISLNVSEIRRASIARSLRWSESHAIATEQRARFDKSEVRT